MIYICTIKQLKLNIMKAEELIEKQQEIEAVIFAELKERNLRAIEGLGDEGKKLLAKLLSITLTTKDIL